MEIPPGLAHLARILPPTLLPCAATYFVLSRVPPLLDLGLLPLWSRVLCAVVAQPVLAYFYNEYQQARDAASLGAMRIPVVYDKWPGGLSLISKMVKSFNEGYPGDFLEEWCEHYGNTLVTKVLFQSGIFTTEPEYIKAILATDFDNYWKGGSTDQILRTKRKRTFSGPNDSRLLQSLLGFGVFNTDDHMWKFHRNLSRPFFSRERISDFDIFDRHAHDALSRMRARLAEGFPVDFQDLASRFTLDSATEFLFGRSVDSTSAGLPYPQSSPLANSPSFLNHPSNNFVRSFLQSQILTAQRASYGPNWPLFEFWKDIVKPHRKTINEYINPILNEALARKRVGGVEDGKEDQTFLNKDVIRDAIFNILIAGRDTTAATLTYSVYMLAEHPDIAERLRKEILDTVGSSKMPTYDDLRGMKYLRAFINETLRLYPPVPFDLRASKRATTWPTTKPGAKPLYIPPNISCRYSVFLMHRRTDLWGPDALTFDPDRFLDERVRKYLTANPFIFLPFNAGPRICLGQQFAYNEASFFLVRLLQNFTEFSLAPDAQPDSTKPPASWKECKGTKATEKITLGTHLTMYAKGGLWVRMKEVAVEE
ncbi:cytochrome P450 [Mycena alexandri]|uniref:Cytochrome P450 n=1 Tax=Mycena alexandri TaxID=1745969 RepID=A0AAD6SNS6_9AGAR|nr:cytochrome P450 [Mycena alexandri]